MLCTLISKFHFHLFKYDRFGDIPTSVKYLLISLKHAEGLQDEETGQAVYISIMETLINLAHGFIYLKK